jgi:hypothetical protein
MMRTRLELSDPTHGHFFLLLTPTRRGESGPFVSPQLLVPLGCATHIHSYIYGPRCPPLSSI